MPSQLFMIGLLAVLAIPPAIAAAPAYEIPAKFRADYALLVEVRVNGSPLFLCQFDSGGANTFALDRDRAKNAGLRPTSTGRSAGVGPAVISDERLSGATLDVGPLRVANQTVVMFPIAEEGCVFGAGILRDFVVQIDYAKAVIRLYNPDTFEPPKGAMNVPFALSAGSPIVDALVTLGSRDQVHASLLVDTAVRRFMALSKGFVEGQRVIDHSSRVVQPPFGAAGTGGATGLLVTRLGALRIGTSREIGPVALLLSTASGATSRKEPDGYLGNEFLHRFLVTLDYPHMRLLLQPNRHYHDAPAPYDGSGLGMERRGGSLMVTAIEPSSAAARAGIAVGDEVLALDGDQANVLTELRIQEKLCRIKGAVEMQVRRGGAVQKYTLNLKPVL